MKTKADFDILLVGLSPVLEQALKPELGDLQSKRFSSMAEVEEFIDSYELRPGTLVLVSSSLEGISHNEIAQTFNSCFDGLRLAFVTMERTLFDVVDLKKNGFTQSFLLPADQGLLLEMLDDAKAKKNVEGFKKFKAVKLIDIMPGEVLPFSVRTFLPMNKKYVLLTASGELNEKKFKMLTSGNKNSVFVDEKQIDKFYDFMADKLVRLGKSSNDAVSATEKEERLKSTVRTLFRSVLTVSTTEASYENGRDLLDQSKKVVEGYVQKSTGLDLRSQLNRVLGGAGDAYDHAQKVSTIACLLSMATGIGLPEDLAIAGLFHDIGIHGFAREVTIFDWQLLEEDDQNKFRQHPRHSINCLKEKKVTLTADVSEIIEKHHERIDGKGFPGQLAGHKIPSTAQLLGYADAFEYLTRPVAGRPTPLPLDCHKQIVDQLGLSPDVLRAIEKFLHESSRSAS